MPVVGALAKRLGEIVVPRSIRFWVQVEAGPAAGIWLKVTARMGSKHTQGELEPAVQDALARLLGPGMVFFDAGANVGYYSLMAARIVGKTGKVIAFEPDAEVRGWLADNVRRNGMDDMIAIQPEALWRTTELLRFERADSTATPDRGTGHVGLNVTSMEEGVPVQGISLDWFCFANRAPEDKVQPTVPDLIKVDVEGAESELLEGATQLLAKGHTKWIVEIHNSLSLQSVRDAFAAAGYDTMALEGESEAQPEWALHLFAARREALSPGVTLASLIRAPS